MDFNKKLDGIYTYKKEKTIFENGMIKNDDFEYKLFFVDDLLYLIDSKR